VGASEEGSSPAPRAAAPIASSPSGGGGPETKEAEALAAALNHSAERLQTLWFTFLTVMLYLLVTVYSTTPRMLFLGELLKLPVVDIRLPIVGFYFLAPFLFVVFHFYLFLNLVLLARTAKSFEDALVRAFPEDGEARENLRMRIENALFVHILVGGRPERKGINAKLMSFVAWVTLVLFPLLLLVALEGHFLFYHDWKISSWHRFLLAVDFGQVLALWPAYRRGWGIIHLWPKLSWRLVWPKFSWRLVRTGVFSTLVILLFILPVTLIILLAVFVWKYPGESPKSD
jgi:hypothetical protein